MGSLYFTPLHSRGKATGKATGRRVSGNGRAQLGNGAGVGSVTLFICTKFFFITYCQISEDFCPSKVRHPFGELMHAGRRSDGCGDRREDDDQHVYEFFPE